MFGALTGQEPLEGLASERVLYCRRALVKDPFREWKAWTDVFLDGVATTADKAVASVRDIHALVSTDPERLLVASNVTVMATRLLDQLSSHPEIKEG